MGKDLFKEENFSKQLLRRIWRSDRTQAPHLNSLAMVDGRYLFEFIIQTFCPKRLELEEEKWTVEQFSFYFAQEHTHERAHTHIYSKTHLHNYIHRHLHIQKNTPTYTYAQTCLLTVFINFKNFKKKKSFFFLVFSFFLSLIICSFYPVLILFLVLIFALVIVILLLLYLVIVSLLVFSFSHYFTSFLFLIFYYCSECLNFNR